MDKKRILSLFILILSFVAGVVFLITTTGFVRYKECMISSEKYVEIMGSRTYLDAGDVSEEDVYPTLYLDEQELFFDRAAGLYYYSLRGSSRDAYNPKVRIRDSERMRGAQVAFQGEITPELIAANEWIPVLIYTEDTCLDAGLKCTTLPLLNINCAEEIVYESASPMELELFDNRPGAAQPVTKSEGYIHVRGQYSRFLPQKSYRLSLTTDSIAGNERGNNVSLLGMRQDDDWILYSGANEVTKVENVFSTNLWEEVCGTDNQLHVDTGTKYSYVEVFLNHEYLGLYALGYPVDELGLSQSKTLTNSAAGEIPSETGALFKKKLMTKESTLTGYIMSGREDFLEIEAENSNVAKYLTDFYGYLEENRYDSKALEQYVDLDNLIDFEIFSNLVQTWDGEGQNQAYKGRSSSYLYNMFLSVREYRGGLLGLYCPWDLDGTWCSDPEENFIIQTGYLNQLIANGDTDVVLRMCEKYQRLRRGALRTEHLMEILSQMETQVYGSGAYLRSKERWPEELFYEDPSCGLSPFKEQVQRRLEEADLYYERLEKLARDGAGFYELMGAQYKDLDQRNIIIHFSGESAESLSEKNNAFEEIDNISDSLRADEDLASFLQSLGVNLNRITPETRYVVIAPGSSKMDPIITYYETELPITGSNGSRSELYRAGSFPVGDGMRWEEGNYLDTPAGRISLCYEFPSDGYTLYHEDCYGVFVEDIFVCATEDFLEAPITMFIENGEEYVPFNFEKDFTIEESSEIFELGF